MSYRTVEVAEKLAFGSAVTVAAMAFAAPVLVFMAYVLVNSII